ncbi:MAG: helix-turn-helix domain-containing protein, partial [Sulfuricella sp.]
MARLVKRAEPNVSRTLGKLETFGFVRLRQGAGKSKIPEVAIH